MCRGKNASYRFKSETTPLWSMSIPCARAPLCSREEARHSIHNANALIVPTYEASDVCITGSPLPRRFNEHAMMAWLRSRPCLDLETISPEISLPIKHLCIYAPSCRSVMQLARQEQDLSLAQFRQFFLVVYRHICFT